MVLNLKILQPSTFKTSKCQIVKSSKLKSSNHQIFTTLYLQICESLHQTSTQLKVYKKVYKPYLNRYYLVPTDFQTFLF